MRVAIDGRSLSDRVLRGWDRYALGLARELPRLGVDVTFLHRRRQPLNADHLAGLDCRLRAIRDVSGTQYEQVAVPWVVWRDGFDLFHAPFEYGAPLSCPRPVVFTIHSVTGLSYLDLSRRGLLPGQPADYLGYDPTRTTWRGRLWDAGARRADHILTPSEFSRSEIVRFMKIPPDRVTATPLAVADQFLRPPKPADELRAALDRLGARPPYLLYVSGYERHKNVGGLLRAFALVRAARPDVSLVLVGSRECPASLREEAVGLGLEPGGSVVFLSGLGAELTDLYDGSALLITLSWRETFCLPALEAMTRGKPVVASSWGATPEVVGETGRLVDPRDEPAARDAVLDLLAEREDGGRAERLRRRAQQFSWRTTAERTLGVYEQVLRAARPHARGN